MVVTPVLIPNTEVKHHSADDTLTGKVGSRQHKVFNQKSRKWSRLTDAVHLVAFLFHFIYKKSHKVLQSGPNPTSPDPIPNSEVKLR